MAKNKPAPRRPDEAAAERAHELAHRAIDNEALKIKLIGAGVLVILCLLFPLACYPIATTFAGRETVIDVSIAIGIAVSLTGVAGVFEEMWRRQRKTLEEQRTRNKRLARQLHVLQERLRDAGLPDTVTEEDMQ